MNYLTEGHDRFEARRDTPQELSSCLAIQFSGLTSYANGKVFCTHLVKMLQKHVEVVAAVWFVSLYEHPFLKDGLSLLFGVWVEQVFLEKPVWYVVLTRLKAVFVKSLSLGEQLVVHFVCEHRPLAAMRVVTWKRVCEAKWNDKVALLYLV